MDEPAFLPPQTTTPFQPSIPVVYFNGFVIALGNADFSIALNLENSPVITLKASYTTAKSLVQKLSQAMDQLESVTQHQIMTTDDVGQAMMAQQRKQ